MESDEIKEVGKSSDEESLIYFANEGDDTEMKLLLQKGVSPDAVEYNKTLFYASKNYMTPLQIAASRGHLNCVDLLISFGADVNAKDRFDVTALHMAAENGHPDCVRALINGNADCSSPTKYSKSGCYTPVPHPGGSTPLHLAARQDKVDCVQELIQYGADYNAVDEHGRTSLHLATRYASEECVLAHLKNAVGRDILSLPSLKSGDTPLHFAVSRGIIECVHELLKFGSDPNHLNFAGLSPLHLALLPTDGKYLKNLLEMLQMLIKEGYNTNVDCEDAAGLSLLHYACFNGSTGFRRRPEVAKFLISCGANVQISFRGGRLLEYEFRLPADEGTGSEILPFIVRSLLKLPRISELKVEPAHHQVPYHIMRRAGSRNQQNDLNFWFHDNNMSVESPPLPSHKLLVAKHQWYEALASNPRTLQHCCRYAIRQAMGPRNTRFLDRLPLPASILPYLKLEHGD